MPTLSLLTGNVGSGKSFFASKLAQRDGAVVSSMDKLYELMEGREMASYDSTKKPVYHAVEETIISSALAAGLDVVVDRTLMKAIERERFIKIGKQYGAKIVSYLCGIGKASELARRIENPRGVPAARWREVFNYMEAGYEPPKLEEGFDELLQAPPKYRFYAFDFDGTIVQHAFPEIGEIIPATVEKINALYEDLANVIIVWSCRSGDYESEMRQFLQKQKIKFDFINDNPLFPGRRKVFAHEYYDDRNACLSVCRKTA